MAIDSTVITEAAAISVPHPAKGEVPWIVCAAISLDTSTTSAAASEIAEDVATRMGKSFRPDRIVSVTALPKTRSGKIVRRAIRATIVGEDIGDLSGIDNLDALDELRSLVRP